MKTNLVMKKKKKWMTKSFDEKSVKETKCNDETNIIIPFFGQNSKPQNLTKIKF